MKYVFKKKEEAAWAVATAVGIVVLTAGATFDPETVTNWKVWAMGIGAASVRAAAGAVLAMLTSSKASSSSE